MGKGSVVRRALVVSGFLAAASVAGARVAGAQLVIYVLEYRERVAAAIRRGHPEAKIIRAGRVGLTVIWPGEEPKTQSPERAHALYLQDPSRLDELDATYARSF